MFFTLDSSRYLTSSLAHRISNMCQMPSPTRSALDRQRGPAVVRYVARGSGRGLAAPAGGWPLVGLHAAHAAPDAHSLPFFINPPPSPQSLALSLLLLLCFPFKPVAFRPSSSGPSRSLACIFGLATLSTADAVFTLLVPTKTDLGYPVTVL